MFGHLFRMDLKRGFGLRRFIPVVLSCVFLILISPIIMYRNATNNSVSGLLQSVISMDTYKMLLVMLFSVLYTSCFCKDNARHYLRMVLYRIDPVTYARSKFLANFLVVMAAVVTSFLICVVVYRLAGVPVVLEWNAESSAQLPGYYRELMVTKPYVFLLILVAQFGMIAAACSSAGLLYSSYQPDSFITIGMSGLIFFLLMSLSVTVLNGTPFDILKLTLLIPVLPSGENAGFWLNLAWGILYPAIVIVFCCVAFEKRMKWRVDHGKI